jgi:hypothetical protein
VSLDEVFHHGLKRLVAALALLVHHHAEHVQDVGALGIDKDASDVSGLGVV